MRWDGQTQEEKERQITGFNCSMGRVGYLRASYGDSMQEERHILERVFENWDKQPKKFRFEEILLKLPKLLLEYCSKIDEHRFRILWANSLYDFFVLAVEKEDKGLNPKYEVSY